MATSIPRPDAVTKNLQPPIPGPTEKAFTSAFGALLPSAQFLRTPKGTAAYYELQSLTSTDNLQDAHRVLLIHGVQTPALGMLPLARQLHKSLPHAHLVLFDLWGHGLSQTPVTPHIPGLFHELIDALLDELKWESAHFVGYSFGGSLTVGYSISRSLRVQSFTLIAPAGLIAYSGLTAADQAQLHDINEGNAQDFVQMWLEGGELVVPQDWEARVSRGEVVAQAVKAWQIREHPGHMASVLAIIRDGGIFDRDTDFKTAAQLQVPSLVVLGDADSFSRAHDIERVGFSDIAVIKDAGHDVVRARIPEVADLIERFWRT